MKKYLIIGMLILFLSVSFVVAEMPDFQIADVMPLNDHANVFIPEDAIEIAPDIFKLPTSFIDDKGRVIQGYAIVDRREGRARPGNICGNGICEPGEKKSCAEDCGSSNNEKSSCFAYFARGAKWKVNEPYVVDASNNAGLNETFVRNTIASAIQKWEDAEGSDILGNEVAGAVDLANISGLNGVNEVAFANINSPGAIAITYVWGIFSGPPVGRELVEWNQVYDDTDFNWSEDCLAENCSNKMDFENIVQHEHGHSFGMAHPPDECIEETMFRFASFGETKKRSLNAGDIAGIIKLYR